MRALHNAIINNDTMPDVGSILSESLPSQAHSDLLHAAAMREAQMAQSGSPSNFDDSLLGAATHAIAALPDTVAAKVASLLHSNDPHHVAAGVKFLDETARERQQRMEEDALGAVSVDPEQLKRTARNLVSLDAPQDEDIGTTATDIGLGFVPGIGTAQAYRDFERARREGSGLGMAMAGIGMIPEAGGLLKVAEKSGEGIANLAKKYKIARGKYVPSTKAGLSPYVGEETDIARSMMSVPAYKKKVPVSELNAALENRARLRAEPAVTPGPSASEQQWADWGAKYGVNMTRAPDVPLGVQDIKTGKDIAIPGGFEGKFTIPDLFAIKANNFDPSSLTREQHNDLMKKFMRTHQVENPDAVDTFNALNFALLSPNAPLTPNEFLQSRFRVQSLDDLNALAGRAGETGLSSKLSKESGVGAAASGGMGVKGTALLGQQADLAKLVLQKPEMFKPYEGETLRDVTLRVMNQVPGLSQKTASLGVPWLDLAKGNTSAVDLHMIRNNWDRLLEDPEVGDAFVQRMGKKLKVKSTPDAIREAAAANPVKVEKAVIGVIGAPSSAVYRAKKTGELLGGARPQLSPEKLAYEPKQATDFGKFYQRIVDYVDESRGANPELPLFPEQWRLWDKYRGRVEPHEFAHPDYKKLPKQSFTEMQNALTAHKKAGYMKSAKQGEATPSMSESDWRKLYYGKADPLLLGGLGITGGLGALGYKYLNNNDEE
jgi:hypothetical protein